MLTKHQHAKVIERPNKCRIWTGRVNKDGYGTINRNKTLVHRALYENEHGPIPAGHVVHHTCRNKLCVNPDHMQALSRAEHLLAHNEDITEAAHRARRAITHCAQGHEFTPENTTYRRQGGWRTCRTCKRESWHRRKPHPPT